VFYLNLSKTNHSYSSYAVKYRHLYSQQGSDKKLQYVFMYESVMFLFVDSYGMSLIGCMQCWQLTVFVQKGNYVPVNIEFKYGL
jgi:hypothetical protein